MHLISWNVNGLRAVGKKGFAEWLHATKPDILGLQEIKAFPEQVEEAISKPEGYFTYWLPAKKPGYSGVAIYSKKEASKVIYGIGEDHFDHEGRAITTLYDSIKLAFVNCYFPNSQEAGARLNYKLDFCKRILKFCQDLKKQGYHVFICGDYNIAHKPIDLTHPKPNEGNPGYLPEERAWMDEFTGAGWVDTFRVFNKEPKQYSWWSYRANARAKNVGWRIDYFCCSESDRDLLVDAYIKPDVMGSDHCPVGVKIRL